MQMTYSISAAFEFLGGEKAMRIWKDVRVSWWPIFGWTVPVRLCTLENKG